MNKLNGDTSITWTDRHPSSQDGTWLWRAMLGLEDILVHYYNSSNKRRMNKYAGIPSETRGKDKM